MYLNRGAFFISEVSPFFPNRWFGFKKALFINIGNLLTTSPFLSNADSFSQIVEFIAMFFIQLQSLDAVSLRL